MNFSSYDLVLVVMGVLVLALIIYATIYAVWIKRAISKGKKSKGSK